jgi:hypothetical protein
VTVLGVIAIVVGLLVAVTFVFNAASVASGMADWHSGNALRYPRYYRFMDWWSLSRKEKYWRWWGLLFGMLLILLGAISLLVGSGR